MTTHLRFNRRGFLRAAATAAAGVSIPQIIPAHVLGSPGRPGANETVRIGIIGLGRRAHAMAAACREAASLRVAAVCDCFRPRCRAFVEAVGKGQKWGVYEDFRRMIEREQLDGVMIETTTHARAWITILAMQAGMDVYIEKPMCLTIAEGRAMVRAARKYGRVTQVGTQQRSMPLNNWASDLIKNGALGKQITVLAPNFIGPEKWTEQPGQPIPQGGDDSWWDVWTNQAAFRPYHPRLQLGWDYWSDYDGGGRCFGVTGWGAHSYDQINRALGVDDTGPTEIVLEEPVRVMETGKYARELRSEGLVAEEDTGKEYREAAKLSGPRAKMTMKFAAGHTLKLCLDGDRGPGLGAIFVGENGKIEINRNKIASNPRELTRSPDNPGPSRRDEVADHIENWIDCIKSRDRCNADIEIGQRSTTLCHLVNIVRDVGRVGEPLRWDPECERFTNCDEGNRMLSRPRRKGYELPETGCEMPPPRFLRRRRRGAWS